jgi:thioredoxin reductase (NADPH)
MSEIRGPIAIVGAGPTGIACAIELQRRSLEALCYDKGFLLNSIYHFPEEMVWFSTRDRLDIAGVPFASPQAHPTRLQSLAYYRAVAEKFGVRVRAETEILSAVRDSSGGFAISAVSRGKSVAFRAPAVVIATGFFHNPKRLGVRGESLPHVTSRYVSAFPYHDRDVVIVGGRNSAVEAALDLFRHGARVTMVVRGESISERVKYWIRPNLMNRIQAREIRALFRSHVREIRPSEVLVETPDGEVRVPADAVFPLIGFEPDFAFLERCGVRIEGDQRVPAHDAGTLESNVPGLYLAGAVLSGTETGRLFIENSRDHASRIADALHRRLLSVHA